MTFHLEAAPSKLCGLWSEALLGSAVPEPSLKELPAALLTMCPDLPVSSPSEREREPAESFLFEALAIPLPPPSLTPARGSFSQALLVFTNSCPDLCFGTSLGCNYMFTDLFPIMSSSEPQHALNKTRQELSA